MSRGGSAEEFNPFAAGPGVSPTLTNVPGRGANAPMTLASPSYSSKEEELKRKEEELARRETVLDLREGRPKKNWPKCLPLIYHDINVEIPEYKRKLIKLAYILWIATMFLQFADFVTVFISWVGAGAAAERFGLSAAYVMLVPLISWFCWYHMLYKVAARKRRSWKYTCFLFNFGIMILYYIFQVIGVGQAGCAGLVSAIEFFGSAPWLGVIMLIVMCKNIALTAIAISIWIRIFRYRRLMNAQAPPEEGGGGAEGILKQAEDAVQTGRLVSTVASWRGTQQ